MALKHIPVLTKAQKEALLHVIAAHPSDWKERIRTVWQSGLGGAAIMQVRNRFGPTWLDKVTAKQIHEALTHEEDAFHA